jgi:S-adenosylmethionine hydrolase
VFVGPDNGLLGPALDRLGGCVAAVELTERRFWRTSVSTTFHGRDVFGPVAGHLAAGVPLEQLGRQLDDVSRPFALPRPDGLAGQVVHVDGYGNLVTNLPAASLPRRFVVRLGAWQIEPRPHYQAVPPGELLALVGSSGLLEISVRDGSAAQATGAQRGSAVLIEERADA